MNREGWARIEPLVDRALGLAGAERRTFLDRLAEEAPGLREEVEAFLVAEEGTRDFLETPIETHLPVLMNALGDEGSWDAVALGGTVVGPYRILRELGRGGMGAVFLAERIDGEFDQRVALKLVRRDLADDEVIGRFRAERQILAGLQHPHVARLLDGGVTESGQPYFAMEWIDGQPLTAFADEAALPLAERLALFVQVCEAVEYAHQNLVVHRDIKPSNILVTAAGQVKLLDFGIAKVLVAPGDGGADVTRGAGRPHTPRYAAPEQILGQPVTTVADVYSLGVVLYELLCGRSPQPLEGASAMDVERRIVEQEAEPPSAAVQRPSAEPDAEAIARSRATTVERLVRVLRGDLDTITAMALRKEPARRYPSVRALADDLRRFRDGRPVSARPDTLGYRTSKLVRRHRVAAASVLLVAASLIAGIVGTAWQARKAAHQARTAEQVKRFALGLFEVSDPDVAKGRPISARDLLDRAVPRIRAELGGQPAVEAEMLLFVGNVYHRLGQDAQSRPLFERALELRRDGMGADPLGVAEAEIALAGSRLAEGRRDEAQALFARARTRRRARLGDEHPDVAVIDGLLGRIRLERGDAAGAEALLQAATTILRRHLPATQGDLAANLNALGRVRQRQGDLASAAHLHQEALDLRLRLHGAEHSSVSESLFNLAAVLREGGHLAEAISRYRELLDGDRRLLGPASEAVAMDLNNLGAALVASGDCREGEARLREAVEAYRGIHGPDGRPLYTPLHQLARAVRCRGAFGEAEGLAREALRRAEASLGEGHVTVAGIRGELARDLLGQGRHREAEGLARRALAACEAGLATDHPRVAEARLVLGQVLAAAGKPGEAETLLKEAVTTFETRFGPDDYRSIEARARLAEVRSPPPALTSAR